MFSPSLSDFVAVAACVIAILSYKQARAAASAAREMADHAIKPFLRIEPITLNPPDGNSVILRIKNYGQGSAVIKAVKYLEHEGYEFFINNAPPSNLEYYYRKDLLLTGLLKAGEIMTAGEFKEIFTINLEGLDNPDRQRALRDLHAQSLVVYYEDTRGITGEVRRG